jgi:CelD/BcsL family acetyltransferase involved in cellulose biosynthesis
MLLRLDELRKRQSVSNAAMRPESSAAWNVSMIPLTEVGEDLAERWQALADRTVEQNPFAGPDVALPANAELAEGGNAFLLAVERGRSVMFALPVKAELRYRGAVLPSLQFWAHRYAFLGTPLLDPDMPIETWRVLLRWMKRHRSEHCLVLDDMAVDGKVMAAMRSAAKRGPIAQLSVRSRPLLRTTVSGPRSKKSRNESTRRLRRLGEAVGGPVRVVDEAEGADAPQLDLLIDRFLELESAGWKGAAGTALAQDVGSAAFFRRICHRHAGREMLQMMAMSGGGQIVAMLCVLRSGSSTFWFKTAFDPDLGQWSPGWELMTAVRDSFEASGAGEILDSCSDPEAAASALFPEAGVAATVVVPVDTLGSILVRSILAARQVRRALVRATHVLPRRRRTHRSQP